MHSNASLAVRKWPKPDDRFAPIAVVRHSFSRSLKPPFVIVGLVRGLKRRILEMRFPSGGALTFALLHAPAGLV
jgi:hypothetical protein